MTPPTPPTTHPPATTGADAAGMTGEQVTPYTDKTAVLTENLRAPDGYDIQPEQWRESLVTDFRTVGCDWLHWFMEEQGVNVVGESVVEMAWRLVGENQQLARELSAARASLAACRAALREYPGRSGELAHNQWLFKRDTALAGTSHP